MVEEIKEALEEIYGLEFIVKYVIHRSYLIRYENKSIFYMWASHLTFNANISNIIIILGKVGIKYES